MEKENSRVKNRSAFLLSIIFIIVLVSIGSQIFLSPDKLKSWIQQAVHKAQLKDSFVRDNLDIDFTIARTTLTGSFFKPFGIRIENLNVGLREDCIRHHFKAKSLVVPLGLRALFSGKVKIGRARFHNLIYQRNKSLCPKSEASEISDVRQNENKKLKAKGSSAQNTQLKSNSKKDLGPKIQWGNLKSLEAKLRSLDFVTRENLEKAIGLIQKSFPEGVLFYNLKIEVPFSSSLSFQKSSPQLLIERLKVLSSSQTPDLFAEWSGKLKFRERAFSLKGNLKVKKGRLDLVQDLSGKEARVKLLLEQFQAQEESGLKRGAPFKVLVKAEHTPLVFLGNFFKEQFPSYQEIRKNWVNFEFSYEKQKEEVAFQVPLLKFYGDLGSLELTSPLDLRSPVQLKSKSTQGPMWILNKESLFKVSNFKVEPFSSSKLKKQINKVFKEYGLLNATFWLRKDFVFIGDLEFVGPAFKLRSQGKSYEQKIESVIGDFEYKVSDFIKMRFEEFTLAKGEFTGEILFDYNFLNKELKLRADVESLKVSDSLSSPLLGLSHLQPLKLQGALEKSEGQEGEAKFSFSTQGFSFDWGEVKGFQSKCSGKKELKCQMRARKLNFGPEWADKLFEKSKGGSSVTEESWQAEMVFYKDLKMNLSSPSRQLKIEWEPKQALKLWGERQEEPYLL